MIAHAPLLGRVLVRPAVSTARSGEPLTFGVPLPRGLAHDVASLVVVAHDGAMRPTTARALERWPDGSVRWALVDTVVDVPAGGTTLALAGGTPPAVSAPVVTRVSGLTASIETGPFRVHLDAGHPGIVSEVSLDGRPLVDATRARLVLQASGGRGLSLTPARIVVEHESALRAVAAVHLVARGEGETVVQVVVRVTVLAGRSLVHCDVEVHNPTAARHAGGFWELGDPSSVLLERVALEVAAPAAVARVTAGLEVGAALRDFVTPFEIRQHSSGGEQWRSRVHVDRTGHVPLDRRGYSLTAGTVHSDGLHATPFVVAHHDTCAIGVASPRFWQVFPKGYRVEADGLLAVELLPATPSAHEIQGGERFAHAFWLGFGPDAAGPPALEWLRAPSRAWPTLDSAAAADAVPYLVPDRAPTSDRYEHLVNGALDESYGLAAKRERIDEYGWRNAGDLYADHENGDEPGRLIVSHYNNQYDAVYGLYVQALRTGDVRWVDLAADLAAHVAHIDVYWTTGDKAAYNGGLFWHSPHYLDAGTSTHRSYPNAPGASGGGPSNEHCYSSGLLLHHYLTGDPSSRAAVISLAEWMIAADDGARSRWPLPWLSRERTGGASATGTPNYHGPGRGAANAIRALLDAHRLTGEPRYIAKADELLRRVVHPADDIAAHDLLNVEPRWSYTVLLQTLGRYLSHLDLTSGRDGRWHYARASLLRYARWMQEHEVPYFDRREVLEFPTETWPAQDVRKSEVFDLAAYYASSAEERQGFLERARFFHEHSLATLAALATRFRTRPLVLLLSYGYARRWFEQHVPEAPLLEVSEGPWPAARAFVPQKTRAKANAVRLAAAATAAGLGVVLWLWLGS